MELTLNFQDAKDKDGTEVRFMFATVRKTVPTGKRFGKKFKTEAISAIFNLSDPVNKEIKAIEEQITLDILATKHNEDLQTDEAIEKNMAAINAGDAVKLVKPNRASRRSKK